MEHEIGVREYISNLREILNTVNDGLYWDWVVSTDGKPNTATVYTLRDAHRIAPFATIKGANHAGIANYIAAVCPRNIEILLSMCSQMEDMVSKLHGELEELKKQQSTPATGENQ